MCEHSRNYDNHDVELIYQSIASGIDPLKAQMSRSAYYGLLVLGGLVGIFELSQKNGVFSAVYLVVILSIFGAVPTGLCFYHVTKSEELILQRRRLIVKLEQSYLTSETQDLLSATRPESGRYITCYCDWPFWVPFAVSLFTGYIPVFAYIAVAAKLGGISLAIALFVPLAFAGSCAFCVAKGSSRNSVIKE